MTIKKYFIAIGCAVSVSATAGSMGALTEEYRPYFQYS